MAKGTGLRAMLGSVLAAAIGVQSQENKERDFEQGRFSHFVVAGLVFTVLFVVTVASIAKLATAGF